jgi:LAO/AO transport system kinase
VVFCVQPGSGDALQFMKAGIVEIPHLIVVTKADLGAAAERARADVAGALSLAGASDWPLQVLAVSSRNGTGMAALMSALEAHRDHLSQRGRLAVARHRQSEGWLQTALRERFGTRGLARLAALGLDVSLPSETQPFEQLRQLTAHLEKAR